MMFHCANVSAQLYYHEDHTTKYDLLYVLFCHCWRIEEPELACQHALLCSRRVAREWQPGSGHQYSEKLVQPS